MAQVKIYGHTEHIQQKRELIREAVHSSLVKEFGLPPEKCFQRFIRLEPDDFVYPQDRTAAYTIVEISAFSGRSSDNKKNLIRTIIASMKSIAAIEPNDVEITIFETPAENWGIRGLPADELQLNYKVEV